MSELSHVGDTEESERPGSPANPVLELKVHNKMEGVAGNKVEDWHVMGSLRSLLKA